MKSTVSTKACKKELPFPKLMVCKERPDLIVLFQSEKEGVVLKSSIWTEGTIHTDWSPTLFKDFVGSICLEN